MADVVNIFRRKAYDTLREWKERSKGSTAMLIEGSRRVGKSTLAKSFGDSEYSVCVMIDFSKASQRVKALFDDLEDIDALVRGLQLHTKRTFKERDTLVIFDEVQRFPRARESIKALVQDGRYDYIETGSLISIKRNMENIVIPSEEESFTLHPMDFEEFLWANGDNTFELLEDVFRNRKGLDGFTHSVMMKRYMEYIAVGGMPQAVEAYIEGKNFSQIDMVKRQIISLYEEDFKKIDASGRISALYHSIPAQLSKDLRKYRITTAIGKKNNTRADELLYELMDSKTVLPCYNSTDPRISLADTKDFSSYKLYLSDTGLFVTLMFIDRPVTENDVYAKLLSDKLPANLGYLYENLIAQMIAASGRELYYHTWEKVGSTHYYEIDFLISEGSKINAFEIKSSGTGKHESIKEFYRKFSKNVHNIYLLSQKDVGKEENLLLKPFYLMPFLT